jgi:hypothetical protein
LLGCGLFFLSYRTWTLVTPPSFQALPPVLPVHPIPIFPSPIPVSSCLVSPAEGKSKSKPKPRPPPSLPPFTLHTLHPPSLRSFVLNVPAATALRCTVAHGPPSISSSTCHALPLTHPAIFLHLSPQFQLQIPNLCCSTLFCSFFSSLSLLSLLDIFHPTSRYRTSNITRNRPRTYYLSLRIHDACYSVHGRPSSASSWSSSSSCRPRVN